MKSRMLVSALRRPLFKTQSRRRAERSFFIWRPPDLEHPMVPHQLSALGILNGFLRHLPRRLVVRGDDVNLERWPPPKEQP